MDLRDWEDILRKTRVDHRVSDSEKKALESHLEPVRHDEQKLGQLRSLVFQIARGDFDQNQPGWIDWLEDINKLLVGRRDSREPQQAQAWFAPEDPIPERIVELFREARREVMICVFTITDDRISNAIVDAHKRGIAIRIITDDQKSLDLGSDIERMEKAGIPVRQDRTEAHMHHKFAIFDRLQLLNGSFNWTRGASKVNLENIVLQHEPRIISSFVRYFEKTWQNLG